MDSTPLKPIAVERRRDDQRYILDHLIRTQGRASLFDHNGRSYPASVKSYRQIPKEMGKLADHKRALAEAAEQAGRTETAARLYYAGAMDYHQAQHLIYRYKTRTKERYLALVHQCYDKVIEFSRNPVERVEFEWEGALLTG